MPESQPVQKYDVFISYSRKDSYFADELKKTLERYTPPEGLDLPKRHLKVFLDKSDFTGPNYDSAIEEHLRTSGKLVVVCSPNARNSTFNEGLGKRYVDHEIEYFNEAHGDAEKNIVLILLSGIPNNEAEHDQESEKAYPEKLYDLFRMPVGIKYVGIDKTKTKFSGRGFERSWYQLLAGIYNKTPSEIEKKEIERQRQYDVFISYSRKDSYFADELRKALERYTPPKDLDLPKRHLKVFLDKSDFTGPDYDSAIEEHLRSSGKLVVVCSPNARNSTLNERFGKRYVDHEIEYFNEVHGDAEKNIVLILLSGVPNNAAKPDQEAEKAYPEKLYELFEMPVGISYVGFDNKKTKVNAGNFKESWYQLLSGIYRDYNKTPAEIQQKELKRQKQRWRIIGGIASIVIAVLTAALIVAWLSYKRADEQYHLALARKLTIQAKQAQKDHIDQALLLSVEAVNATEIPLPQAQSALLSSLATYPHLKKILWGHRTPVFAVAISPDGKQLASVGSDGDIWLWDAVKGQPLGEPLQGHNTNVMSVVFSPDGHRLASAGLGGEIRLWDVKRQQPLGELWGHIGTVASIAFSRDGKLIASAGNDKTVRLWNVEKSQQFGEPLRGHEGAVSEVAFSPDGTRLVSASEDRTVRLWDVENAQPIGEPLRGHEDPISSVSFSPDGKRLATGGNDKAVRLWDAISGRPVGEPLRGHTGTVFSVAFSPDGQYLASASSDKTIRLWNPKTGQLIGEPLEGHYAAITTVTFSPDGTYLATASVDKTIRLWNPVNRGPLGYPLRGHEDAVISVAFSPESSHIISLGEDGTLRFWDTLSFQSQSIKQLLDNVDVIDAVALSPDRKYLASSSLNRGLQIWDTERGQPMGERLKGYHSFSIAFSPDGKRLASGELYGEIRLWDTRNGQPQGTPLQGHQGAVFAIVFSPDGKRLASGSGDNTIRLWDAKNGQPIGKPLQGHKDAVYAIAFSPNGTHLASAGEDKTVRLWDTVSGQPLGEPLRGHEDTVSSVAFSPNGQQLATVSKDGEVRLWDATTGKPLYAPLRGHTGKVFSVAFSPDGKRLASAGSDKTVRLWNMEELNSVKSWQARACEIANRNLTLEEWKNSMGEEVEYHKTCF